MWLPGDFGARSGVNRNLNRIFDALLSGSPTEWIVFVGLLVAIAVASWAVLRYRASLHGDADPAADDALLVRRVRELRDSGEGDEPDRDQRRPQLTERIERCQAGIRQTDQVKLANSKPIRRTIRFFHARLGQLRPGRYSRKIANTFRAVGCDDEMCLASLSRKPRQQRANDSLVVGVGKNCHNGSRLLRMRGVWGQYPEGKGGKYTSRYAHTIECCLNPPRASRVAYDG